MSDLLFLPIEQEASSQIEIWKKSKKYPKNALYSLTG